MNDSIYEAIRNYIVIQRTKAIPENDEKEHIPKTRIKVFTGTVDPNSASFEKLVEFGFNTFQANNIVNYRNSGGVYKLPEDMLKIYGIDSVLFLKFRDHIKIVESLPGSETEKYVIPFVELNAADTAILKSLPGIGSAYASRIIKYRDLLGGFYSPQQLLEVYNFPEETFENISEYLSADTLKLEKLRINFFEFPELLRHPYLDKKQVEELINYRQSNGAFKNLDLIESLETFDRESFERVKPYLTCR
jgi:DNA uptake protein ComE-like DNA-binding protein